MIRLAFAIAASLAVVGMLVMAVLARPARLEHLPARVAMALPEAGANHPVTAVLLDFRGYDTLLEVAVLLVAVVAALALREAQPDTADRMGYANPLLRGVMAWLFPAMLLVAAYLLWVGNHGPGGAFHAGAVLAAAGVSLRLAGVRLAWLDHPTRLRLGLAAGLIAFLIVGITTLFMGHGFLDYPKEIASSLFFVIETAVALSTGLALLSLFRLAPPQSGEARMPDRRARRRP
jgi:multisubunit Na+/H+ antiporter MnhB subunit